MQNSLDLHSVSARSLEARIQRLSSRIESESSQNTKLDQTSRSRCSFNPYPNIAHCCYLRIGFCPFHICIVQYVCPYGDDRVISTPNRAFLASHLPINKSNQSACRLLFLVMFSLHLSIFEHVLIGTPFLALFHPPHQYHFGISPPLMVC